jgi:hypothetical protein
MEKPLILLKIQLVLRVWPAESAILAFSTRTCSIVSQPLFRVVSTFAEQMLEESADRVKYIVWRRCGRRRCGLCLDLRLITARRRSVGIRR